MKHFLIFITLLTLKLRAQTDLTFDKRFVQSEDKWVAFKPDKDSSYTFGFIYIDADAGLTLNVEGTFKMLSSGEFMPKKQEEANVKVRLQPNNVLVAFIPESKFEELRIQAEPEWLKFYKTDINSADRLYKWGFMYNGWNECEKGLEYLEKLQDIEPRYAGLAIELSYSYNCLEQYDKAEVILEDEIQTNTNDAYANKEYIYTLVKNKKIDLAVKQFRISLNRLDDKQYHAENCFNIMQYYYESKDKDNFNVWYKELKKHPTENKLLTDYATIMKDDLK